MTISELKLDFLWMPNPYKWLGKTDPFQKQWASEYVKCNEFLKTCSIEEMIRLYIISYKDKYPKEVWFEWLSDGDASAYVKEEKGYSVVEGNHFIRKDILKYSDKTKKDKDDFSYVSDRILQFRKAVDFSKIVEEELQGKQYHKIENGSAKIYKLIDNPIDFIEITNDSFRLKINDKYHVHMR